MNETYKDSVYTKLRAGETFAEQGKLHRASERIYFCTDGQISATSCAHAGYGFVLMRQQEVSKAQSEFEQELRLNPGCNLAKLGLAAHTPEARGHGGCIEGSVKLYGIQIEAFYRKTCHCCAMSLSEDQREQLLRMAQGEPGSSRRKMLPPPMSTPNDGSPYRNPEGGANSFYLSGQYQKCAEACDPHLNTLSEASLSLLALCAFYTGDYRTASSGGAKTKIHPGNARESGSTGRARPIRSWQLPR